MDKYHIKPLEWEGELIDEFDEINASTPFGSYHIALREDGGYLWGFCFDEYYDEDDFECDSVDDGKLKANNHWIKRIAGALQKV